MKVTNPCRTLLFNITTISIVLVPDGVVVGRLHGLQALADSVHGGPQDEGILYHQLPHHRPDLVAAPRAHCFSNSLAITNTIILLLRPKIPIGPLIAVW